MEDRSTVEAYAAAMARLVDPFANRPAVLREMGLDEAGWREFDGSWRAELARRSADGDSALADAFVAAFGRERDRLAAARGSSSGPRVVSAPAPAPARASREIDATAVAQVVLEPALPFAGSRSHLPLANMPEREVDDVDRTRVMDEDDELGTTLPFFEDS